jgi:S-adenosyl-L-methionine hydrolase (adenosine-forming)
MMSSAARPCITLITDFGLRDPYAGIMKGVILNIVPSAVIVDVTHEIDPCDLLHAAFVLKSTYAFFPRGTIHIVVVDPGVGSDRRPILVVTNDYFFVAPDNGLLFPALSELRDVRAFHVTNSRFFLHPLSHTFHGRDVFAPVAAWLCREVHPEEFGDEFSSIVELKLPTARKVNDRCWRGEVLRIDRFGNLITSLPLELLDTQGGMPPAFRILIEGREISRFCLSYTEVPVGDLAAIAGSAGFLEIVSRQASAADVLSVRQHDELILEFV